MNTRRRSALPTTEAELQSIIARAIAAHDASREESNREPERQNSENNTTNPTVVTDITPTEKGCTYKAFMACKPWTFKGTEGAVGVQKWIEKTEKILAISGCAEKQKVLYVTCLFEDEALAWWNAQVQTLGEEVANSKSWMELKEMLRKEYCSRSEMQELAQELWNHTLKGSDITSYTTRFNELSRLVPHLVTPEEEKVDRYISGLPAIIRAPLQGADPPTFYDATKRAAKLVKDAVREGTLASSVVVKTEKERSHNPQTHHNNNNNNRFHNHHDSKKRRWQQANKGSNFRDSHSKRPA